MYVHSCEKSDDTAGLTIGVLALQGAFREHATMLRRLGAEVREVRLPGDLEGLDGLVIPGGESTTMGLLMQRHGLEDALKQFVSAKPVFGTCAGLILLARATTEGEQPLLGVMDIVVRRNAFGRQLHSFEGPVLLHLERDEHGHGEAGPMGETWPAHGSAFHGVFIRAPWVERVGPGVRVIATYEDRIVGVKQGHLLGVAFHPELTEDTRLHAYFLDLVARSRAHSSSGLEWAGPGSEAATLGLSSRYMASTN